jgi:hypothetical protein
MIPRDGGSGSTHSSAKPTRSISAPSLSTPTHHPVRRGYSRSPLPTLSSSQRADRTRTAGRRSVIAARENRKSLSQPGLSSSQRADRERTAGRRSAIAARENWKSLHPPSTSTHHPVRKGYSRSPLPTLSSSQRADRTRTAGRRSAIAARENRQSIGQRNSSRSRLAGTSKESKGFWGRASSFGRQIVGNAVTAEHRIVSTARNNRQSIGQRNSSRSRLADTSKESKGFWGRASSFGRQIADRAGTYGTLVARKPNSSSTVHHYKVELKSWIPQSSVVDPLASLNHFTDGAPPNTPRLPLNPALPIVGVTDGDIDVRYSSSYRGDSHIGYEGSWRAVSYVDFDYDGHKITNFQSSNDFADTHRDWNWEADYKLKVGPFSRTIKRTGRSGVETAQSTALGSGKQTSSNNFALSYSAVNGVQEGKPVVGRFTPAIDAQLNGSISSDGEKITLHYDTDLFPSHGVQVVKDGNVISSNIVNDASDVNVQGVQGSLDIATRLAIQGNEGELQIPIG